MNTNSTDPQAVIPNELVVGYDNYKYEASSEILSFFTYVRYYLIQPRTSIIIRIIIIRNLRALEEISEDVTCELVGENDENKDVKIEKYKCEQNVTGTISKVEVKDVVDLKESSLAQSMGKEIQNQKGDIIADKDMVAITDCVITQRNDPITIKGKVASPIKEGKLTLYLVQNDGTNIEVPATINNDNNEIEILFSPKRSINSNLDGVIGKTEDGNYVYLSFNQDKNSTDSSILDYSQPSYSWDKNRKKSGGLSAGGIVAIIIPCILVLLIAAGLAFFLGRKPPTPPNQNLGNTIGVTSSSNVVN